MWVVDGLRGGGLLGGDDVVYVLLVNEGIIDLIHHTIGAPLQPHGLLLVLHALHLTRVGEGELAVGANSGVERLRLAGSEQPCDVRVLIHLVQHLEQSVRVVRERWTRGGRGTAGAHLPVLATHVGGSPATALHRDSAGTRTGRRTMLWLWHGHATVRWASGHSWYPLPTTPSRMGLLELGTVAVGRRLEPAERVA